VTEQGHLLQLVKTALQIQGPPTKNLCSVSALAKPIGQGIFARQIAQIVNDCTWHA